MKRSAASSRRAKSCWTWRPVRPSLPGEPNDCDALRVDLSGQKDGHAVSRRAEMIVLPHTEWKVAAGSLDTGVPLSIAGQLLGSRTIRTPGVLCPETAVPGELFFEMLERRQMRVRWS